MHKVEFDAEQFSLRVNGTNVEENEHIKLGQHHTVDITIGKAFTIEKDCWDSIFLQRLNDCADPSKRAEVAAIVMQEGIANICLITSYMTVTIARIQKSISKKVYIY